VGRWIIGIGLVAIISIGAIVFRDVLPGDGGGLKVGDCFDVPTSDEIDHLQHHPCTEAHDGEVIFVGDLTGTDTYPTAAGFDSWVKTECAGTAFQDYVGDSFEARKDVDLGYFPPKKGRWNRDRDRVMICYLTPAADGTVTVSFAETAPAS
jgi:hypothetical protein